MPIGIFDSGVGGLSVLRAMWAELPRHDMLYVADSANCPYGPRPEADIRRFSLAISRFLIDEGCPVITVACNTASAAALHSLRIAFPTVSFVGMVPAVKPAALHTRSGVVGVLATPATSHGALYQEVVTRFGRGVKVLAQICPGLVGQIESGAQDSDETRDMIARCIAPLIDAGADTIVLGCTHYPFVQHLVAELVPAETEIIEPSAAVARQCHRIVTQMSIEPASRPGNTRFLTTGDVNQTGRVASQLLKTQTNWEGIHWRAGGLRWEHPKC